MNVLYLGPDFPSNFHDFSRALHGMGNKVLGVGETPHQHLPERLQGWLTDYYRVDSLGNYAQLRQACHYFQEHYGTLDRVDSHAEYWIETEARLRSDFNISGIKLEQMPLIKRKSKMKQRFVEAGIPVSRGRLCHEHWEAQQFAREVGFPLVAKPDIGVGAASTYKLNTEAELEGFFRNKPAADYFFEEFISGKLCSFDGLTDRRGEAIFTAAHQFSSGIMEIVNDKQDLYYYSERFIPQDLQELGLRTLRAFEIKERFFHLEFFRTPHGLKALEVNVRIPGGWTANMFCWANDIDIFVQWAKMLTLDSYDGHCRRPYHVAYVGRRNAKRYQLSHPQVLERFNPLMVHHAENERIFAGAIGDYAYLLRHRELAPLTQAAQEILAKR